jgi:phage tail-like protein
MSTAVPAASSSRNNPFTSGNFRVEIPGIATSSFSEVFGLEASIDVVEYRAGDAKLNTERKLPGLNRFPNITLKRGLTQDISLWNWFNTAIAGNVVPADVAIALLDQADNAVLMWRIRSAWPCKWTGPMLMANSSEIAIEALELCHEGLELVVP